MIYIYYNNGCLGGTILKGNNYELKNIYIGCYECIDEHYNIKFHFDVITDLNETYNLELNIRYLENTSSLKEFYIINGNDNIIINNDETILNLKQLHNYLSNKLLKCIKEPINKIINVQKKLKIIDTDFKK